MHLILCFCLTLYLIARKEAPIAFGRANAVYNYLVSAGINIKNLKATGFGESNPVDTNDTHEGRQSNRRVEFKFVN